MKNFSFWCLCGGLALCWSCSPRADLIGVSRSEKDTTCIITAQHIHSHISKMGQLSVELQAPLQREYTNGDVHFPEGIWITNYDDEKQKSSEIKADSGFYFQGDNIYEARGNVRLRNLRNGNLLETEKLTWNPTTERVYTDQDVRIEDNEDVHMGKGLNASDDFSEYRILKPQGTLELP